MLIPSYWIKTIKESWNGERAEHSNVNKKIKIFFTIVGLRFNILEDHFAQCITPTFKVQIRYTN